MGELDIAVVGMALRVPGAGSPAELWRLLSEGRHGIRRFSRAELLEAGVSETELDDPAFVPARPVLEDPALFEPEAFGLSPREGVLASPEQRLLLECSREALERAGLTGGDTGRDRRGGVFLGVEISRYLLRVLVPAAGQARSDVQIEQAMFGNDKDHAPLRIAHRLDLRGPALALGSTCSSSLLAVHQAAQSLLNGECDYALAGGASVDVPWLGGYRFREGGLASPDGYCRPYDAGAGGTVFGSGAALVVLMRFDDAQRQGHPVGAVLRGSAVNNDGAGKQNYAAPGVEGQARVIAETFGVADMKPLEIAAVEGNGMGTALGDAIEVEALHRVYGVGRGPASCVLGSVKSNLGHLGAAAGIAGFAKAVLMAAHRTALPTAHFRQPNPELSLGDGPFLVLTEPTVFSEGIDGVAVGSFGIGGTNVHAIVSPPPEPSGTGWMDGPVTAFSRTRHWKDAPAPTGTGSSVSKAPDPGDDVGSVVMGAVAGVLGVSPQSLSPQTDIIELGVDSFLAAELSEVIQGRYRVPVPVPVLHANRTVAELTSWVERHRTGGEAEVAADFQGDYQLLDGPVLEAIYPSLAAISESDLIALEPLMGEGALRGLVDLQRDVASQDLVGVVLRTDEKLRGLFLLERRDRLLAWGPTGPVEYPQIYVTYTWINPEDRGQVSAARLASWWDSEPRLGQLTSDRTLASTLRFRTPVCHKHGRVLAATLARSPEEQDRLFTQIYFQNFDAAEELQRLVTEDRLSDRLRAAMAGQDYEGVSGSEILEAHLLDSDGLMALLRRLIPEDIQPGLTDTHRRLRRGEVKFAGFELRWLEAVFVRSGCMV